MEVLPREMVPDIAIPVVIRNRSPEAARVFRRRSQSPLGHDPGIAVVVIDRNLGDGPVRVPLGAILANSSLASAGSRWRKDPRHDRPPWESRPRTAGCCGAIHLRGFPRNVATKPRPRSFQLANAHAAIHAARSTAFGCDLLFCKLLTASGSPRHGPTRVLDAGSAADRAPSRGRRDRHR